MSQSRFAVVLVNTLHKGGKLWARLVVWSERGDHGLRPEPVMAPHLEHIMSREEQDEITSAAGWPDDAR